MLTKFIFPKTNNASLRLLFTSDEVVDGVVIRSVERHDLLKIKPTDSEAEHRFRLGLSRLRSCAGKLDCRSRKQKRKNK